MPQLQPPALSPAGGQCQIFLNLHGGRPCPSWDPETPGPEELARLCSGSLVTSTPVNGDGAGVHLKHAGNGVEHGGLAGAVAADDGDEIAVVQMSGSDRSAPVLALMVPGLKVLQISASVQAWALASLHAVSWHVRSSSREWPGTRPRSGRIPASGRWCSGPAQSTTCMHDVVDHGADGHAPAASGRSCGKACRTATSPMMTAARPMTMAPRPMLTSAGALKLSQQAAGQGHQPVGHHQAQHHVGVGVDALRPGHVGVGAGGAEGAALLRAEKPVQQRRSAPP